MTEQVHSTLPLPGTKMTTEEFLALPETLTRIELIDGVVIYPFGYDEGNAMSPAPTAPHQNAVRNLFLVVNDLKKGDTWFTPLDVEFPDGSVLQPDVFWYSENHKPDKSGKHIVDIPDLIIEVLSPSSDNHDKNKKFHIYEKAGVAEYWLADTRAETVDVWQLIDGEYQKLGTFRNNFHSPILDAEIPVTGVFV
ncbi:MAG: Uma2 family endonuclease [Aggregatilineales bacterium]